MRPIKFRGKINGTWKHVSLDEDIYIWSKFWAIVDRNTLGQFTRLKDGNDKEIYEGDILKIDDCDRMEIIGNIYDNPELLKDTTVEHG